MKIHLNDTVKIRVTQLGKDYLRKQNIEIPSEDREGYCRFQLWMLMQIFADYFDSQLILKEPPFEGIEIDD